MSQITKKNTKPEIILRKALSKIGIRGYRLYYKLLGTPDIVFPKRKIAIFIDGCFWHKCPKCAIKIPLKNREYWNKKIKGNIKRDKLVNSQLKEAGWKVLRFWEHEINKNLKRCIARVNNAI